MPPQACPDLRSAVTLLQQVAKEVCIMSSKPTVIIGGVVGGILAMIVVSYTKPPVAAGLILGMVGGYGGMTIGRQFGKDSQGPG